MLLWSMASASSCATGSQLDGLDDKRSQCKGQCTEPRITVSRFARANIVLDGGIITDDWDLALASAGLVVVLHGVLGLRSFDAWVGLGLELGVWCRHSDACIWR
jgi:hypothetical protein